MLVLPIFIIAFLLQLIFPWWIIGFVAFCISFWLARSATQAFWGSFVAIALLWLVLSSWNSFPNDHILANRVGQMFMLPTGTLNWLPVLLGTCLIGALAGALAGLSGYFIRRAFWLPINK